MEVQLLLVHQYEEVHWQNGISKATVLSTHTQPHGVLCFQNKTIPIEAMQVKLLYLGFSRKLRKQISMHRHTPKDRDTPTTFTHSCASCKAGQEAQSMGFGRTLSQAHQVPKKLCHSAYRLPHLITSS